jgi:hypothetical protein
MGHETILAICFAFAPGFFGALLETCEAFAELLNNRLNETRKATAWDRLTLDELNKVMTTPTSGYTLATNESSGYYYRYYFC